MQMQPTTHETAATLQEVRALFRSYAQTVRQRFGSRVSAVWLYGSAARGDWTAESDIDVLVLLDTVTDQDIQWLVETAYRMGLLEHRLLIQPIAMTQQQFEHLAERERRFALDVLREGIAA
jgi:predicted nucleotidyltransferase